MYNERKNHGKSFNLVLSAIAFLSTTIAFINRHGFSGGGGGGGLIWGSALLRITKINMHLQKMCQSGKNSLIFAHFSYKKIKIMYNEKLYVTFYFSLFTFYAFTKNILKIKTLK